MQWVGCGLRLPARNCMHARVCVCQSVFLCFSCGAAAAQKSVQQYMIYLVQMHQEYDVMVVLHNITSMTFIMYACVYTDMASQ